MKRIIFLMLAVMFSVTASFAQESNVAQTGVDFGIRFYASLGSENGEFNKISEEVYFYAQTLTTGDEVDTFIFSFKQGLYTAAEQDGLEEPKRTALDVFFVKFEGQLHKAFAISYGEVVGNRFAGLYELEDKQLYTTFLAVALEEIDVNNEDIVVSFILSSMCGIADYYEENISDAKEAETRTTKCMKTFNKTLRKL